MHIRNKKNLVISLKDITQLYQLYFYYCKLTMAMLEIIENPEESAILIMESKGIEVEAFLATPTASPNHIYLAPSSPNQGVSSDIQHIIPRGRIDQSYDTTAASHAASNPPISTSTQPALTNISDPFENTGARQKTTLSGGVGAFSVLDEIQL